MAEAQSDQPVEPTASPADLPDRLCTWCKVPMQKRLVGGGKFIHYTCPKCVFQHTTKHAVPKSA
ncbi:MAG: hypothetical protein AB1555_02205 [Nitrospirota bacterium]